MLKRTMMMVAMATVVLACGDGANGRKKLAAQLETAMRKASGIAVKISTRGDAGTVLVMEGIGDACDPDFLAEIFSKEGPMLAPKDFVDAGFKRVECELVGHVAGVNLPVGDRTPGREEQMFGGDSKSKIAKMAVDKYAFEAYGSWAPANQSKACPDTLDDLREYMNSKDTKDPWGTPYRMKCGSTLPPSVESGIAVESAGPDQKFETEDDIKSW